MLVDFKIIPGPYLQDVLEQPGAVERTLAGLEEGDLGSFARALTQGKYRRVVLTGMGSSFHALHPLNLALIHRGWPVFHAETSELIHYMPALLDEGSLVIAVSQSGQSAEILRLLEITNRSIPVIGITNTRKSTLALRSSATIFLEAGAESSVSCKTYVASLLALEWLAAILEQRDLNLERDLLSLAAPAIEQYLQNWRAHVSELYGSLSGIKQIFVAGRGPSLATAGTGGLILKESVRFSAEGMSCAAFRHGPFEMTGQHVLVIIYTGDGRSESLNRQLADDIRTAGGKAQLVDHATKVMPLRIPKTPDQIRPLVEILPVQMISLALAARNGHEAGRFTLATKVTAIE